MFCEGIFRLIRVNKLLEDRILVVTGIGGIEWQDREVVGVSKMILFKLQDLSR